MDDSDLLRFHTPSSKYVLKKHFPERRRSGQSHTQQYSCSNAPNTPDRYTLPKQNLPLIYHTRQYAPRKHSGCPNTFVITMTSLCFFLSLELGDNYTTIATTNPSGNRLPKEPKRKAYPLLHSMNSPKALTPTFAPHPPSLPLNNSVVLH